MPNPTQAEIKNRISEFVDELDMLVRKSTLEALKSVLVNGSAAPRGRGRPAGTTSTAGPSAGRRGRRSVDLSSASEAMVAHVRSNDGQGISAIADATGIDLKTAKKAAIQLLASGALKKSGERRGTVYHMGSGKLPEAGAAPASAGKAKRGKRAGKKRGRKSKAA